MSSEKESQVLTLLQPDLFSTDDLIKMIKSISSSINKDCGLVLEVRKNPESQNMESTTTSRCPRLQNLETAPKERLVKIFRQMILPLPQRIYRTNRRGKILTSRRAKAGLEAKPRREGEKPSFQTMVKSGTKRSLDDRLKPPPDSSTPAKIRIGADKYTDNRSSDLDKIIINDTRKNQEIKERKEEKRKVECDRDNRSNYETASGRKIVLKRSSSSSSEKRSSPSRLPEPSFKKQKKAIKWP